MVFVGLAFAAKAACVETRVIESMLTIDLEFVFFDLMTHALAWAAVTINGEFGNASMAVVSERPAVVGIGRLASAVHGCCSLPTRSAGCGIRHWSAGTMT